MIELILFLLKCNIIEMGRVESGRSWGKRDGLGEKWTVQLGESGWSKTPKVDSSWLKLTIYEVDGQQKMKLDGPSKCVGGQKG